MNILCINLGLPVTALQSLGHTVLGLSVSQGLHELAPLLLAHHFEPDMVIQREMLGERVLFLDLPSVPCPKAFWSIDTHLNWFWQRHYSKLFDVLLTPHASLVARQPDATPPSALWRMPWWGEELPWTAHTDRAHSVSFVGRLDAVMRPLRASLGALLQRRYGVNVQDALPFADMIQLYTDTRLLPNESIAFETNFRLLEGASAGCCVLTPAIGEDQDTLLEPGRECLVYTDGLELVELLDFCLRHPAMAERIGAAARQRVLAEHLPVHRALRISDVATAPRTGLGGMAAQHALWLTAAELGRNSRDQTLCVQADHALAKLEPTAQVRAMRLQLAQETGRTEVVDTLLRDVLAMPPPGTVPDVFAFAAFTVAALRRDTALAHTLWQRLVPADAKMGSSDATLCTLPQWCLALAEHLRGSLPDWNPSFYFIVDHHCPNSSFELIALARHLGANALDCARATTMLPGVQRHLAFAMLGSQAQIVLEQEADWLARMEFGLTCLRCYRVSEGLHELTDAASRAKDQGQRTDFEHALCTRGASHVLAVLGKIFP